MRLDEFQRPVEVLLVSRSSKELHNVVDGFSAIGVNQNTFMKKNGEEALMHLQTICKFGAAPRPDIIFIDPKDITPGSYDVLSEIQTDPDLRDVPVVIFDTSENKLSSKLGQEYPNCLFMKTGTLDSFLGALKSVEELWLTRSSKKAHK